MWCGAGRCTALLAGALNAHGPLRWFFFHISTDAKVATESVMLKLNSFKCAVHIVVGPCAKGHFIHAGPSLWTRSSSSS
jgi:hypothetical protein